MDRWTAPRTGRSRRPLALLAASLALAACGSASPTPAGSAATSGAAEAGATPTTGGTLSIAFQGDIGSLDPAIGYDTVSWPAERLLFDTLVTYDAGTRIVPLLARTMPTVSADGRTYTFDLRDGVDFVRPDGSVLRPLRAADVAASLARLLDPKLKPAPDPAGADFYADIEGADAVLAGTTSTLAGVKVLGPTRVEFDLARPDATFLQVLALPFASIVPAEVAGEDTTAFAAHPVGSGPYLLRSYTKGQAAVFIRNPHFWDASRAGPDEIDLRVGVDGQAALQQVEAGSLDLMGDPLPAAAFGAVTADPRFARQVVRRTLVETQYLAMDTQPPAGSPLADVRVRQAIAQAVDKSYILKLVHGAGVAAGCIFPPDLPGYDPSCDPYPYDPAAARRLLAVAGYPNGFSTTLYTDTDDPDPRIAGALRDDLAAIGVRVDVVAQAFDTYLATIAAHKAPLAWNGWVQDFPDPSDFIDPLFSCASAAVGNSSNPAFFCDHAIDALAARARAEPDGPARLADYREIQRRIMAQVPWVPVRFPDYYTLVGSRVRGFALHPVWIDDLRSVWLAT